MRYNKQMDVVVGRYGWLGIAEGGKLQGRHSQGKGGCAKTVAAAFPGCWFAVSRHGSGRRRHVEIR